MTVEKRITQGLVVLLLLLTACGPATPESEQSEYAHIVGDLMSGFNDGMAAGGFSAMSVVHAKDAVAQALLGGSVLQSPAAQPLVANCSQVNLSTCATGTGHGIQTRTFSACTFSGFTYDGDIVYTHSDATCTLSSGKSVSRTPNYTVTGRRGNTLNVYGTDPAQTISEPAPNSYTFSSTAITRAYTDTTGAVALEYTSQTTSDVSLTNNLSSHQRTITAGTIQVNNITNADTCSFTPTNVLWDASCACPVSGFWTGACSGGTAKITFTGCGVADFAYGDQTTTLTLDHCF